MPKTRIKEKIIFLKNYIIYFLRSSHRNGHGIHSPFVYDFVTNVLFDKKYYPEYNFFRNLRSELMNSEISIEVVEIGSGSRKFSGMTRRVSDMVRTSSVNEKTGWLLFRISRYYKPLKILELGTSIGLSTICLAKGGNLSNVFTIEGNSTLCYYSKNLFLVNKIKNIEVIEGLFDEKLKTILPLLNGIPLIFIDGNHSYMPTMNYFRYFSDNLDEFIVVFDDISWSEGMRKAWKEIVFQSRGDISIDLFNIGIIIRKKNVTPGNYRIRY